MALPNMHHASPSDADKLIDFGERTVQRHICISTDPVSHRGYRPQGFDATDDSRLHDEKLHSDAIERWSVAMKGFQPPDHFSSDKQKRRRQQALIANNADEYGFTTRMDSPTTFQFLIQRFTLLFFLLSNDTKLWPHLLSDPSLPKMASRFSSEDKLTVVKARTDNPEMSWKDIAELIEYRHSAKGCQHLFRRLSMSERENILLFGPASKPSNHNRRWSPASENRLLEMFKNNASWDSIGFELGCTIAARKARLTLLIKQMGRKVPPVDAGVAKRADIGCAEKRNKKSSSLHHRSMLLHLQNARISTQYPQDKALLLLCDTRIPALYPQDEALLLLQTARLTAQYPQDKALLLLQNARIPNQYPQDKNCGEIAKRARMLVADHRGPEDLTANSGSLAQERSIWNILNYPVNETANFGCPKE
ncbi:hypothetical protein BDB00DRAFT_868902 [Zychaea mexicana]|uniref:uncharacterized protein n=1 Tax=Zychaea mexicana TaxID=64656 RepID=UPI0022FDD234|nr:uncharacterized protein BDB00DRAFT_868902 [Zychaea mexicana]KAI9497064.1 hypothetical protein BDB00DRAFT_868902 [Zychaea mexicana]